MRDLEGFLGDGKITSKGDEIHWNCPFCGDHRKRLFVHLFKHVVFCHNCFYSGSVVKLLANLQGITYQKALKLYQSSYGNGFYVPDSVRDEVLEILKIIDPDKYFTKQAIPLPEEFESLFDGSFSAKIYIKSLKKRGISEKLMEDNNWGYCGYGEYEQRAILSIYLEGKLTFWVARAINKSQYMKEKSPSNENWQIGKSEVIYNIDKAAKLCGRVVLSEGIYDAATFGDVGAALLGSRISEEQLNLILTYKEYLTGGVYLALDEDAKSKALDIAEELYKYVPVYFCDIKDDPNKMGKKLCREAIDQAEEFSPLFKVRKLFT